MDKAAEKLLDYFHSVDEVIFCVLLFLLPFGWAASIVPLMLFIVIQAYNVINQGSIPSRQKILYFAPLLLYFLWSLVSILWSPNTDKGFSLLGQQLSLFLIPLTYLFLKPDKSLIRKGVRFFIMGVIISALVIITKALLSSLSADGLNITFNSYISEEPVKLIDSSVHRGYFKASDFSFLVHPSYYGLMMATAALYMLWGLIPGSLFPINMKFATSTLIFFSVVLMLLSTNALLLTLFSILLMWLWISIKHIKHHNWERILAIMFGSLLLVMLFYAPQAKQLLHMHSESLQTKMNLTQSSLSAIGQHFWAGTGLGGEQYALNEVYKNMNLANLNGFNAHNQFFQTWIASGMIGFLLLVTTVLTIFIRGLKHNTFLLLAFAVLMWVALLFETLLYRYWGVVFFAIFYSLIYFFHELDEATPNLIKVKFKRNQLVKS